MTWTKCIENNYLLVYKVSEFAVECLPAVRNKAEIIFTCINVIAKKKIISVFCYLVDCAPHLSLLFWLNSFFRLFYFLLQFATEEKEAKATIISKFSGSSKMWSTFSADKDILKHLLENYRFCQKSGNYTYSRG